MQQHSISVTISFISVTLSLLAPLRFARLDAPGGRILCHPDTTIEDAILCGRPSPIGRPHLFLFCSF